MFFCLDQMLVGAFIHLTSKRGGMILMCEIPPKKNHRQIPHNPTDSSSIDQSELDINIFEKRIISIHNLMIQKGYLPSLDPIRRAAEEVDGIFESKLFSSDIIFDLPDFLLDRLPKYGERRVLALETVLLELGFFSREDLKNEDENYLSFDKSGKVMSRIAYTPYVEELNQGELGYQVGDWVEVVSLGKKGHIRTPVYLLRKKGKVVSLQGSFLNPEDVAHFKKKVTRLPLYLVEFVLEDVWGKLCPDNSKNDKIRVELYEHWLTKLS